MYYMYVNYWY